MVIFELYLFSIDIWQNICVFLAILGATYGSCWIFFDHHFLFFPPIIWNFLWRIHLKFCSPSRILVQNIVSNIIFNVRNAFLAQTSEWKFIGAHWGSFCLIWPNSVSHLSIAEHRRFSARNLWKSCTFSEVLFIWLWHIYDIQIFSRAANASAEAWNSNLAHIWQILTPWAHTIWFHLRACWRQIHILVLRKCSFNIAVRISFQNLRSLESSWLSLRLHILVKINLL